MERSFFRRARPAHTSAFPHVGSETGKPSRSQEGRISGSSGRSDDRPRSFAVAPLSLRQRSGSAGLSSAYPDSRATDSWIRFGATRPDIQDPPQMVGAALGVEADTSPAVRRGAAGESTDVAANVAL